MEIFILTNCLLCGYKSNAYCLKNLSVSQSVDVPWMGDFAVSVPNKGKLRIQNKDCKWGILPLILEIFFTQGIS